ncbi:MAG: hypothetical protein KF857_06630 [Fimbriimonadaceae bacterium]|nr:hypothetical protein [Fimbriimonadaceae bacterium]
METRDTYVSVKMTQEEAYEILSRCLQSQEEDNPVFLSAIRRIAKAAEHPVRLEVLRAA